MTNPLQFLPTGTQNKRSGKKAAAAVYEIEAFTDISEDGKACLVKWKGGCHRVHVDLVQT